MYCSKCGKEVVEGSEFCSYCGAKLNNNERNFLEKEHINREQNSIPKRKIWRVSFSYYNCYFNNCKCSLYCNNKQ